jgi:hypothetical protein
VRCGEPLITLETYHRQAPDSVDYIRRLNSDSAEYSRTLRPAEPITLQPADKNIHTSTKPVFR